MGTNPSAISFKCSLFNSLVNSNNRNLSALWSPELTNILLSTVSQAADSLLDRLTEQLTLLYNFQHLELQISDSFLQIVDGKHPLNFLVILLWSKGLGYVIQTNEFEFFFVSLTAIFVLWLVVLFWENLHLCSVTQSIWKIPDFATRFFHFYFMSFHLFSWFGFALVTSPPSLIRRVNLSRKKNIKFS